ncbi:wax ester/triacylglycerol synthase domain-containing protein [Williamsia maris]|uniref:diacylglycerol O-acyltransferase n=1 Tax=Williamsia maris TaxID=72806 RepID=A0ABT1HCF8_9NOCA|nr:wax ester/triacylglycerol synthase domain-containing protein [Williamsia maris]MCP2175945.1 acyltransferase, WS/DGAT/MGAT [Williamsia maris]
MKQLASRDAAYLYLGDAHRTSTIVSCWVVAERHGAPATISADQVVGRMATAASQADVFAAVLVRLPLDIDLPYWRLDPDFDVRDHIVFHHDVADWSQARDRLSDIAARPLDRRRPLWRIDILVDVEGMPGRTGLSTVVAMMFHHAAFDGVTFAHLTNTYLDDAPFPWPYDAEANRIGSDVVARSRLTTRALVRQPVMWGRCVRALTQAVAEARRSPQPPLKASSTPTVFGDPVRGVRRTDYTILSLTDVKAIKNRIPGAKVNDVLLSIIGGAMVAHTGVDASTSRSLVALVPVSTRTLDAAGAVNQFVPTMVDMHTDEARPEVRIAAIARSSQDAKAAAMASALGQGAGLLNVMPALLLRVVGVIARLVGRVVPSSVRSPADAVVANVYSPYSINSMFGMPVVGGFGIQPLDTPTLAHGVYSRDDQLFISVTTDSAVLADQTPYLDAIAGSFARHLRILEGDG